MSMELLSQGFYSAAQDDEKDVVKKVADTAELVGVYVEPSVYCKLILPYLKSICNSSAKQISSTLLILASYVRGSIPELLKPHVYDICQTLDLTEVSSSIDASVQTQIIGCIGAVLSKSVDSASCCIMFKLLLNVLALSTDSQIKQNSREQLTKLSDVLQLQSQYDLFKLYGKDILHSLKNTCEDWCSRSTNYFTYTSLLTHAGDGLSGLLDIAVPIFIKCCDVERDGEMRLKLFTMMSQLVLQASQSNELLEKFREHSMIFLKDAILPNCVWKVGRTAATIRSAAMSFLWALLEGEIVLPHQLKESSKDLQVQVISCLDDHNETTRLVTSKVLLKMMKVCKGHLNVEELHALYPEVLKRMDDVCDDVRIVTTKTFSQYFSCLPESYDREFFKAHLEHIYKSLLLHMDDTKDCVQNAVLLCLKDGAPVHPLLLKKLTEDVRLHHRTKTYCDELIDFCEKL